MFRSLCAACAALFITFPAAADETVLSLTRATQLALESQPLLAAQSAAVAATRESAVSAAQLPDPVLSGGLTDLTVGTPNRFSFTNESDTQFIVGVKQQFYGGNKRELRGARFDREADRLEAERSEQTRMIARETGLLWLEAWKAQRAQGQVRDSIAQASLQVEAAQIAFTAGRATQAEVLAARVSLEMLNDQLANLQQMEWHARNQLRRWIGKAADQPLAATLPDWPAPDAAQLNARLESHPHVLAQSAAVEVANAALELSRADYSPDFSVMAGYGYRPNFANYASLTFEVGLPFFAAQRQDRGVAAALRQKEQAAQLREDWLRQHRAEIALNIGDWQRLRERLARYDNTILPQAQQRLDSALAAYGAGASTLMMVLDARRSLLDIRLQKLDLELDSAKHQVTLAYFNHEAPGSPGDAP